ncbi:PREDICTED: uncharacterized protein LOC109184071 [Ipomoea nil]|uniref:uncharacterized protein LOC109184071 n=1 Tax=Ipomoea nil TaxID=35883 RepID=UPI000901A7E2|nr:PREDICTED: uncharacterized protein LOC109184071 [Ipomoea nil]
MCMEIERVMNRYWWGAGNSQGIHWKAWDKLCIPKKHGGLGFKDLRAFNLAMLGKQAWRLLTKPEYLVASVYKARYYPKSSFYEAKMGNNPSFCWRSIMAAKSLDDQEPMIQTEMPVQLADAKVVGLIDQDTGTWDHSILTDLFQPIDVENIKRIPISPEYDDSWYWHGDPKGIYSVKNGYRRIVGNYEPDNGSFDKWLTLWSLKIPPKWKTFLWRAISDILPTTTNLIIKRVEVDPNCAMCGIVQEDTMHALVLCDFAKAIWERSSLPIPNIVTNVFHTWFSDLLNILDSNRILYATAILYHIWRARNGAVWDAAMPRPTKLLATVTATVEAWRNARLPPASVTQPQ